MPNQPKTPQTSFRIPVELSDAAKAKAKARGESLTAVVVRALDRYVKGDQ
jgi:predicted HicB family RNase H-like nuclease